MNFHVVPNELYLNSRMSVSFYFTFINVYHRQIQTNTFFISLSDNFNRTIILIMFETYSNLFLNIHWAIRKEQLIQNHIFSNCKTIIIIKTRKQKEQSIFSLNKSSKGAFFE